MKIFGREPAALVGVIEGVLAVLLSFGLFDLHQNQVAAIVAVVTAGLGLVTAYATRDTMLGVLVGFSKSVLVLAAAYGLNLSDQQTAGLIAVITLLAGYWHREHTMPLLRGSFSTTE